MIPHNLAPADAATALATELAETAAWIDQRAAVLEGTPMSAAARKFVRVEVWRMRARAMLIRQQLIAVGVPAATEGPTP